MGEQVCSIWCYRSHSLILSLEVQNGTSCAKKLSGDLKKELVALHKDGRSYKRLPKTLKLSLAAMVAKTIQWFNKTCSTQNRHRHGHTKEVEYMCVSVISRGCVWEIDYECCQHFAEVEGVGGRLTVLRTIHRNCIKLVCMAVVSRRMPLLRLMHRKSGKRCWRQANKGHGLLETMTGGLMKPRYIFTDGITACVGGNQGGVQKQVCLAYS